jgi:hypothetical protein
MALASQSLLCLERSGPHSTLKSQAVCKPMAKQSTKCKVQHLVMISVCC